MKTIYNKYVIVAVLGMLTACSAEDADMLDDAIHEPVVLKASLAETQVSSRVISNQGNTANLSTPVWGSDLLIALAFSDENDMTSASAIEAKVKKYKVTENANPATIAPYSTSSIDAQHYWSSKTKAHYVCGWCTKYPNSLSSANYSEKMPTVISPSITQSSWTYIDSNDFLFAPVQEVRYPSESTPTVINFYHQMTMVEIRFNFTGTSYSASDITACKFNKISGRGTWQYPTTGNYGTFTPSSSAIVDFTSFKDDATGSFKIILIPQNIGGKTLTFTTNIPSNETMTFTFPSNYELKAGSYYTLTFNFGTGKSLTLKTQITDWDAVPAITGNLNL